MATKSKSKLKAGDIIEYLWVDAAGADGPLDEATVVPTKSLGYFVGWTTAKVCGKDERFLITQRNQVKDDFNPGWDATPDGMVRRVTVLQPSK